MTPEKRAKNAGAEVGTRHARDSMTIADLPWQGRMAQTNLDYLLSIGVKVPYQARFRQAWKRAYRLAHEAEWVK